MHLAAHWALLLSLLGTVFLAGMAAWNLYNRDTGKLAVFENGQSVLFSIFSAVSIVLFIAFVKRDFSFEYVQQYSDKVLPLFYTITAFWAGQAGSLLFWAWMTTLCGFGFSLTKAYMRTSPETKLWFWLFFLTIEAFFLLLLTGPNNPFTRVSPIPMDGKGLNPLLQNPGMIFHPPLLFLGYAGFTIPACLALASWMSGQGGTWLKATRSISILSWIFLTAGIILGGWWSYMELGWGGYWAWDPVENASLIPWLTCTAFLHTAVVQSRRGALAKTNVFLISLTLLLCFFGTYLVRSGVVESLHAFGEGGVGRPLLTFILSGMALTLVILAVGVPASKPKPLSGLYSLPGFLVVLAWLLLALAVVVFMGTMWPVFSKLWSQNSVGLDQSFYNRVCNPLFVFIAVLLVLCPWMSWKEGLREPRRAMAALAVTVAAAGVFFAMGYHKPVPLVGASAGVGSLASLTMLTFSGRGYRTLRGGLGAWLLHGGLAMVFVGVAISGPYQLAKEAILSPGQTLTLGAYELEYTDLAEVSNERFSGGRASLTARKDGREVGVLTPERRVYKNFPQPFAEVSVIPSLGDELYATLLAYSDTKSASIKVSVNPLVNWVWIGGTIMCLAGFLCLRRNSDKDA